MIKRRLFSSVKIHNNRQERLYYLLQQYKIMKLLKNIYLLFFLILAGNTLQAQNLTQTVRGTVVDNESKFPLIGVNVIINTENGELIGAVTDIDGNYRLDDVPLGRQQVKFTYIGYQEMLLDNIIVTSAKEVILNIELEEAVTNLGTVDVVASREQEVRNEMATVSARQFSVTETNKYAGSRGEPARMASNFAGVQGADDSRNDIVVRGNTPQGVLWRLEGINIPNPNHFAIPGTGGGPVTILNNKFLANSDFFTGAFPAEYGNAIAGVFDLRMRNGNNEKHEFSGQLGFLGTEITAEGPLSKNSKASYLVMGRYSTLQLFSFMGINVGTDAIPQYSDGAFRLNFPRKNGGNLAIWGIGGLSTIDIVLSDAERPDTSTLIFGSNDRDQYFSTNMGILGATYTQPLNKNTFVKAGVAYSSQSVYANHDQIYRRVVNGEYVIDSLPAILDYQFTENKLHSYFYVNYKFKSRHTIKAGFNADLYGMFYIDSVRTVLPQADGSPSLLSDWRTRWDADDNAILFQPYVHYKYKASERLTLTAGLTSMYFSINNNSFSPIEPRLGLSYDLLKGRRLSFGFGMHSQIQSPYLYYYSDVQVDGNPQEYNLDMGLTKSTHAVLAYDMVFKKNYRIKLETYYQYLNNVPVDARSSSFSLLNAGSGFSRFFPDTLQNAGSGRNYGFEFTLEKFFSDGYYFLVTASLFDAKYQGSDGVLRNSTFNGRYAANALFAKEWTFKEGSALNIGGKVTTIGGRWYGPVDTVASAQQLEIIYQDETVNTLQFRPYFRADFKVSYRWNRPKVTHELAVDFVNVFNTRNILTLTYAPDNPLGPIREEYQLGFLPLFYYKLDF